MPPEELVNVVWPAFSGHLETYWGRNPLKLHGEYLGVITLMLATFAFQAKARRRLIWFFVFLALYALLFSFGGHTPFYYLPYYLLPGISKTRAPSIIFFLVSLSAAVLAALGVDAALDARRDATKQRRVLFWWLGVLAVGVLLAASGVMQTVMIGLADPQRVEQVVGNYPHFTVDTIRTLLFGGLLAGVFLLAGRQGWSRPRLALVLTALVLLDLWSGERRLVRFSPRASQIFAADAVVSELRRDQGPYRVLPGAIYNGSGSSNYLMTQGIRSVLGYNGQELHRYDELLGGKNVWQNVGNSNLWRMLAVKYVVVDRPLSQIPGLTPVGSQPLQSFEGQPAYLYRFDGADPYAYLAPAAVKVAEQQIVPTLLSPGFDPRRLLLVPTDAPAGVTSLSALPAPIEAPVRVTERRPGAIHFDIATPPPEPAFLFVSENFYPDWHATVDGTGAPVVRAQYSLMAVPVPAGAHAIDLVFHERSYTKGKIVTLVTMLGLLAVGLVGVALRRPARAGG
jgi:hypothetical protein